MCVCVQDVLRVVEQVLGFDRSMEEDLAYPTAGLPAPPPLTWPTAAEVPTTSKKSEQQGWMYIYTLHWRR